MCPFHGDVASHGLIMSTFILGPGFPRKIIVFTLFPPANLMFLWTESHDIKM